jgi:hypothetical protein
MVTSPTKIKFDVSPFARAAADPTSAFTSAAMLLHKAYEKWLEARTQSSSRVRS